MIITRVALPPAELLLALICRRGCGGRSGWQVYFSGHGLGGAVATLAAATLAMRLRSGSLGPLPPGIRVGLYTFGSPRVGDAAFARAFNRALTDASALRPPAPRAPPPLDVYRHVYENDVVPTLPSARMGYKHVGAPPRRGAAPWPPCKSCVR